MSVSKAIEEFRLRKFDELTARVAELEGELEDERVASGHAVELVRKEGEWRLNAAKAALKRDRTTRAKVKELQAQLDRATSDQVEMARELTGALEISKDGQELEVLVGKACGRIGLLRRRCESQKGLLDRAAVQPSPRSMESAPRDGTVQLSVNTDARTGERVFARLPAEPTTDDEQVGE